MVNTSPSMNFIFERQEKKFLVEPQMNAQLMQALAQRMEKDQYGLHTISSIYYDTDDFAIIRRSMDKPNFKEKLRLRSYGTPSDHDIVFVELKKKFNGITYKRRIAMKHAQARDYLDQGIAPQEAGGQIFGEIDWYVKQNRPSAKVLISYDRIALFDREKPEFRITFDQDIRWRDQNLNLAKGDYGTHLLDHGQRIMEVKTLDALPLWLCEILSDLKIYPRSYTKYGTVYCENFMNLQKEIWRHVG